MNWAFADRFKIAHDSISIKYDFENWDNTHSFKVSARKGGRIRPSYKATAGKIRTLASKIRDHSRLIQKASTDGKLFCRIATQRFRVALLRSNLPSVVCLRSAESLKKIFAKDLEKNKCRDEGVETKSQKRLKNVTQGGN